MRTYEESLKVYRDNYSVIETAKIEGRKGDKQNELNLPDDLNKKELTSRELPKRLDSQKNK